MFQLTMFAWSRSAKRRMPLKSPPNPARPSGTVVGSTSRPLEPKRATPEDARTLRAKREQALRHWLADEVLRSADAVRLSTLELASDDAPRRWLDVARARHLGGARGLARLGIRIESCDGTARVGGDAMGMEAPDAAIERAGEVTGEVRR